MNRITCSTENARRTKWAIACALSLSFIPLLGQASAAQKSSRRKPKAIIQEPAPDPFQPLLEASQLKDLLSADTEMRLLKIKKEGTPAIYRKALIELIDSRINYANQNIADAKATIRQTEWDYADNAYKGSVPRGIIASAQQVISTSEAVVIKWTQAKLALLDIKL